MDAMTKSFLKNDTAHNIAQRLLTGEDIYDYLGALAEFLLAYEKEQYLTLDEVHEIYLHAYNQGKQEADYVLEMYNRYNMVIEVKGHSGSQLTPAVTLEKYFI